MGGGARLRSPVLTCVQLSSGRMTNIEYTQNKKIRESVEFCTGRRKAFALHSSHGLINYCIKAPKVNVVCTVV
jgi:hypothetical protein